MSDLRTFVDSSTLIALLSIGELEVLRRVIGRVHITEEVRDEVLAGEGPETLVLLRAMNEWIKVHESPPTPRTGPRPELGPGEMTMLSLPQKDNLVLDDLLARRTAIVRGRNVTGLLGILLAGARTGRLGREEALRVLEKLVRSDFRMSTSLYVEIRKRIEEV